MPDILSIKTQDWELSVWSRDIEKRAKTLTNTLYVRGKTLEESVIGIAGPIEVEALEVKETPLDSLTFSESKIALEEPLFFENLPYEFEFIFHEKVSKKGTNTPHVRHKLSAINEVFHYVNRRGVAALRGAVNFRNDIGWFHLPLRYWIDNKQKDISLSFEVLPTKMDLANDLRVIYSTIDKHYPLWRFALAERTEQDSGTTNKRTDPFPLFWISLFKDLQDELHKGVTLILHSPHSRLLPNKRSLRAERLKGKLPAKLAENVKQDIRCGNTHNRYAVGLKKLSVDTLENRFIKMVIRESRTKLSHFSKIAAEADLSRTQGRLSDAFFNQISDWQKPLSKYLGHPLFKEVGSFKDMNRESLVLQQKPGYSKVYKVWQQLKLYLDVLGNQTSISMKSVAELYEVWCFLEVRRILIEELGFEESKKSGIKLSNKGHELVTVDGFNGAFEFTRDDGISINLAHEPVFKKNSKLASSWLTIQKPDILLKATFDSGDWLVWLFDAKYRIKEIPETNKNDRFDEVPDDAINQMHRYRDALIHQHKEVGAESKSRPVFGAFALYPGYFDQSALGADANYYSNAINEIGIGAFPLLPSSEGSNGSFWLQEFLKEKLGERKTVYPSLASADKHYVDDSARIPYTGLEQIRYSDLTMTMPLGPTKGRAKEYPVNFENGTARWYHVPETSINKKYASTIMNELKYCAVPTISAGSNHRTIKWVWQVKSARLLPRKELTLEQAGSRKNSEKLYWLLELGEALRLDEQVIGFNRREFNSAMKLTTLEELTSKKPFKSMRDVYQEFFGKS